jgi:nicotinate-nucleotide adenylyltransferase
MRIAILGGAFDPPHLWHKKISEQLIKLLKFDQVWLIPCFSHPFDKKMASSKHRLAMTRLLQSRNIKVRQEEIKRKKKSYSIDTIKELKKKYPKNEFTWIIGSDQIKDFPKWKSYRQLLKEVPFFVFPRPGNKIPKILPHNMKPIKHKGLFLSNLSSTKVRNYIKHGKKVSQLVTFDVEEYIKKHGLYKTQNAKLKT